MKTLTQPIKWHGGKHYLAPKIIALMPPRCEKPNNPSHDDPGWLHYVEPYAGGLSVLLANDPEGISEVANDLNSDLFHFWLTLREPKLFSDFKRAVEAVPFSEECFEAADVGIDDSGTYPSENFDAAVSFFIRCRQSLSGRMAGFAGITRNRTRKSMNEQVSAWLNTIEGLPAVHERLKRVLIRNQPALDVIRKEDGPRTLFYLDPPYLHETRATTGEYAHEMTEKDHSELLNRLVSTRFAGGCLEGRFLLSGYRSGLYDDYAARFGWTCHEFDLPNNSAGGKTKQRKTECVWTNY